ncbi:MAG: D-alanyl-D-alanine carboxypeptidase/D-alanyl-D-alanine-endopeptidase, partial [Bacteroidota bacterium]
MRFILLPISFMLFAYSFAFAQDGLQSAIDALAKDETLQAGAFSMTAIDIASGEVIATYAPDKSLIPASSLKVITTATALSLLGADFQFKTELQYDGILENGVLNGNLYIKGYGDPTLASDQMKGATSLKPLMKTWAAAIQKAGIRQITGKIIGDDTYFDGVLAGDMWSWADLGNYYGAGAWGLNLHENFYYLDFQQVNQLGQTPKVAET